MNAANFRPALRFDKHPVHNPNSYYVVVSGDGNIGSELRDKHGNMRKFQSIKSAQRIADAQNKAVAA